MTNLRAMLSRVIIVFSITASFLLFANPDSQVHMPSVQHDRDSFIIARVSSNPKKHFKHLMPMANYLAANLHDFGIKRGEVLFAKDNQQMIDLIKQGRVDLITDTAFSAVIFNEQAGAEIVLRRWKKGVAEYSSVIFSHNESGINSFSDLVGKTIAFQDRGSSSAYYIPASILIRNGYQLHELQSPNDVPPANKIGFVFANKEINISAWVHKGIVAAGAFNNLNWDNERDMPTNFKQQLQIIYTSEAFPRGVELQRSDLNPALKHRVVELLTGAHENEAGQRALKAYQKTTKYDDLTATSDIIELTKELQQIVSEQL